MSIPFLLAVGGVVPKLNFGGCSREFAQFEAEAILANCCNQDGAEKVLAKYVRTSDEETLRTALEHQAKILPDIPYPLEDGIKTILEDIARSAPEARNISPSALIDTSIVRDASQGL